MTQNDTTLEVETPQMPQNGARRTFLLPLERFQEHLAQLAKGVGGNAELGRRLGVTGQFIDLLITGKRKPGPKMLKAIGARKKVMLEFDAEEPNGTDS